MKALLGTEADVVAGAVDEEVGRRAVDELIALLGDLREEGGANSLPHHAVGDRHLLEEDVLDVVGRVNSDAVAHPSPPEVVGHNKPNAVLGARHDYNAALSKFV
jgi:hypothetical protein